MSPVLRRRLRVVQGAAGVWTVWALVQLLLAPSAAADNCSVFTDCFGVANSAVEAAFGLSLLAALSIVLDFVPFVGTAKGIAEGVIGRDLLTGQELAGWERALGVLPFVGAAAPLLRNADLVGDAGRAAGRADGVRPPGQPGRGASASPSGSVAPPPPSRPVPPPPAPPRAAATPPRRQLTGAGSRAPLDPAHQRLVDQYPGADPRGRTRLSEQLGELGGLQYLQDASGDGALRILRPTSDADVADLVRAFDEGRPWDTAVAFGGSRATNLVHFDGTTLRIVEAKGGDGRYGDRVANLVGTPTGRIDQTHPQYPRDVADDMAESKLTDGRRDIGPIIEQAYQEKTVEYVAVRTGPRSELLAGTGNVTVEDVFLTASP